MKLRRLLRMPPAELACRGWQEAAKHLERIGLIGNPGFPAGFDINEPSPAHVSGTISGQDGKNDLSGAKALFDRFWETAPPRFFEGPESAQTSLLLEKQLPGERERIMAHAEDISEGCFDLLGYKRLFFGDPVDWHLDPVSGRRAPFEHWSRLDPLNPAMTGDSKVIWELNRHQWFVSLGQAYRHTGDEHYAGVFATHIKEWMRANPPGIGINWTSSLELSLRLISWCWALFLFRGSRALSPELFANMFGWIGAHASRVERYLSYYFSPNTHLTGEALGLFYAGTLFPGLRRAGRWRALGTRILVEQIGRQALPDGVYFEQSTCYQRYTVEIYLHFLILGARHGVAIPAEVGERVQQMLDFLLIVSRPGGAVPSIGDADGGTLLPLVRRSPDDFRGLFATAAAFFGRPDYAWAAGGAAPEVYWLLGPAGGGKFDALRPAPPAAGPSRFFADGGYAVMRNGWDRHAHQLIFDAGPLGCPDSSGHGHADLLGIQCALFGEPCLIDPGTGGYTAEPRWRDYFRGTAAHSTVTVDGLGQADPDGPFKWRQRPRARLRRWLSNDAFDLADADHDAYHRLPDPVTHRRRVLFSKPRYWLVIDELDGKQEHRIDLRFQFAPSMQVLTGSDGWVIARHANGRGCRMLVCATTPLEAARFDGQLDPIRGWNSPDYGRREPSPQIVYSTTARLPLRFVTLLFPADEPLAASPVVAVSGEHRRIDLVFEDGLETLHIGDRDIVVERLAAEDFEPLEQDISRDHVRNRRHSEV